MRVLLVEDDALLGSGIRDALEQARYAVEWVRDGALALEALRGASVDLVVLDLGLPKLDGMEVLRRARELGAAVPILVLSARDTTLHRIGGLDAGADDYMAKPFDVDELLARLRALERRARGAVVNLIRYGAIEVDTSALTVTFNSQAVDLQRREFMVLRKLLENVGSVMSRQQLVDNVYGWDSDLESNALDVHIHNLRRKLYPELIRTVRGVGYVIDPLPVAARQDA
ncbi:MAG TPA: response regulator transcription factor [Methyloversatilis sp.]